LTVLASVAQLLETEAPGRQSYYPTIVFLFAGVLLLHPFLFVLLVAIPHLVEWARARLLNSPRLRDWYIQPFNIATHIIAGLAAYWVYALDADVATFGTLSPLLAAIAAALTYLLLNHLLIGQALVLARGLSWRESGVMEIENLLSDLVMLFLGFSVAMLWKVNPWLSVPALFPLLLIYRALKVPRLRREAQTDEKTGLWNARHFSELSESELERASRFNRPAALVLADLDLLREINNAYGHLAGDTLLAGLGQIIRDNIREYDIAGRFGGEEFCILMPEARLPQARFFAERLRKALEEARFQVKTSRTPIGATMSLGVACFPSDAITLDDLIQRADMAMYQAKVKGRNCVVCWSEVPQSVKAETRAAHDDLTLTSLQSATVALTSSPVPAEGEAGADVEPEAMPVERETQVRSKTGVRKYPGAVLPLFVGAVIAMGVTAATMGSVWYPQPDLLAIALFALLAAMAEGYEVNLYGPSTVSVSVAVNFAAALVTGLPGVACVSAAIALVHWSRMRPPIYRTAFNWALHVLAGSAPALVMGVLATPLQVPNLLLLAIPVGASALAYYAIECGLLAVAIGLSTGRGIIATWDENFRWLAEHYLVLCMMGLLGGVAYVALGLLGIILFPVPVLMMHYTQKQYVERTEQSVRELKRMNEELTLANREIVAASGTMKQLNEELLLTLAKIIDARDPYVSGHNAQVADYATTLAIELGLPSDRVRDIRQAAFLHDIGKIGVSELILGKPGRLTAEEYEQVKSHAALGAEFLETCQSLRHLVRMVRHHHERWDGTGYPDGIAGEQIPLEARIMAICDAVEAMGSDRPYRRAMALNDIIAEVKRCAGTQFDPDLVQAFLRIISMNGEELVINSAGEVARRVAENGHDVSRVPEPTVVGAAS